MQRDTDIRPTGPVTASSTWYAPKPDALSGGFTVQELTSTYRLHVTADTELVDSDEMHSMDAS